MLNVKDTDFIYWSEKFVNVELISQTFYRWSRYYTTPVVKIDRPDQDN